MAHLLDDALQAYLDRRADGGEIESRRGGQADAPGGAHRFAAQVRDARRWVELDQRARIEDRRDSNTRAGKRHQGAMTSIVAVQLMRRAVALGFAGLLSMRLVFIQNMPDSGKVTVATPSTPVAISIRPSPSR